MESDSSADDEQEKALKDEPIRPEVHRYRSEPKLPADLCPLQDFWKKNCTRFPHLAKLAKKYLAVLTTWATPSQEQATLLVFQASLYNCAVNNDLSSVCSQHLIKAFLIFPV